MQNFITKKTNYIILLAFMNKIIENFFKKELDKLRWGTIQLNVKNLYQKTFIGAKVGLKSNIFINDLSVIKDFMLRGDLGFAEGYIDRKWETKNLNNLLKILLINQDINNKDWKPSFYNKLKEKVFFFLKKNSIKQAKENIKYHYDLGNDFYKYWLDSTMTYSSGIFKEKNNLTEAQLNKYKNICEGINLNKKHKVCEIGSGWGGFLNYAGVKSCEIDGITISKQQYDFINNQKNILNSKIYLKDYRNINKKYDKVVSIEMFEAVGKKYWNTFFEKLNSILNLNGEACLQIITIDEKYYAKYLGNVDFIQKYIFPGGMLPTKQILLHLFKKNNFTLMKTTSFGKDYSKTLMCWKYNFNKNWDKIKNNRFDDKFKRLWNYYLDYCETGFSLSRTNVSQFFLKKIK